MFRRLLDLICCPDCGGDLSIAAVGEENDGEIRDGNLVCQACEAGFPIRDGVPRFVSEAEDYCKNFGFQWLQWGEVQIDRLGGHRLSEARLLSETGLPSDWFKGKLVLDAGCGAGRFADVALGLGAEVIACDLSDAVDAARENLAVHGARVHVMQASIYALPIKREILDGAYCLGVIQHTPEPAKTIAALPPLLKPGGRLGLNFYEKDFWPKLQVVKYALRLITPHLPLKMTLGLARALVAVLFPLTRFLARIPKVRIINHFIPVCSVHVPELTPEQQYIWTVLDTFDWYGPRYEIRQDHRRVAEQLRGLGLVDVTARKGMAQARKAPAGATY